jgi:hypothetical protein
MGQNSGNYRSERKLSKTSIIAAGVPWCPKTRRERYRERLRQGKIVLPLEVDAAVLDLFVRERIATEAQVIGARTPEGRKVLGEAIGAWFRRNAF